MNEVVVESLSYEGTTLNGDLNATGAQNPAPHSIRLEVYLDNSNVREPYLIQAEVAALGQGPWAWPIERCWPFENEAKFELWVTPATSTEDRVPDTDTDRKIDDGTVVPSTPSGEDEPSLELGHEDLALRYSVRDAPQPVTQEVNDEESGETRIETVRTRAIESAIQDFDTDHDHPFLDGEVVKDRATALSSRLDIVSADGNSPDGFPDEAVDLADQDDRDYCAAAALLFAFSQKRPRRLVEFCRSIYDPISIEADGSTRYGHLSNSVTTFYNVDPVEQFYENQQEREGGRTIPQVHVDVLILLIRALLTALPEIPNTSKDQYRSVFSGLTFNEERELLEEVLGLENVSIRVNAAKRHSLDEVLDTVLTASSADEVCLLNIDSLLVEIWKPRDADDLDAPLSAPGGPHTISLLSMTDHGDDTYTIDWQNPWGGQYGEEMTVDKEVLGQMLNSAVVTGVQGAP